MYETLHTFILFLILQIKIYKIKMRSNILFTVRHNLCTGCGLCEDMCPTQSIQIKRVSAENIPILNAKTCLGDKCSRCLKVCPGIGIDLKAKAKELFNTQKQDKYIGHYTTLYTGYSNDNTIRYHSASGGIVSQFLIYLLEKKIIEGAVVTSFSDKDHITPISYIARNKEDILKAKSSKYCPVALNKVGNEIKNSEGKYIIVGLPCHIQGFRKRAEIDKKFRERILGYFSIYCSSNRTFNAQDFLLRKYQIEKNNISYFSYRDNGCLGNLTIKCNSHNISVPYVSYYGNLRSFFKPRRCLTCIDHYGELADVCFGDIHIPPYSEDKIGINSWIIRNPYFDNLFKDAAQEGYLTMEELDAHTLNESQKAMLYPKQRRAHAIINMDKIFGKATVKYDTILDTPTLKDYVAEVICHCQRFIGKHPSLWWIIDFLYNRRINKK